MVVCLMFVTQTFAQSAANGVVQGEDGSPIIGATVILEKTPTNGTVTDQDGKFSLSVNSGETLVVSFLGYDAKQVVAGQNMKISLTSSSEAIEEVVVVGYGTVKKSDLTGSLTSLSDDAIAKSGAMFLDQAMTGQMAGVSVVTNSGEPGAGFNIQIRGASSVNASSQPLYVIDGFPMEDMENTSLSSDSYSSTNPLSFLNPADIESLEVLKDASSTAIYGSRGANGVVLITTKSGADTGKTNVVFDSSVSFSNVSHKIDVMQGQEFVDFMTDFELTQSSRYFDDNGVIPFPVGGESVNWQDEMYKTGIAQNYSLSVDSAWKTGKVIASASYADQGGIIDNSNYDRFNVRARVNQSLSSWLKMDMNANYSNSNQDGVIAVTSSSSAAGASLFQQVVTFRPVYVDSYIEKELYNDGIENGTNPFTYLYDTVKTTETNNFNLSTSLVATINKHLTFTSMYSFRVKNNIDKEFHPSTTSKGKNTNGLGIYETGTNKSWVNENYLNYSKVFNDIHSLNAMVGVSISATNADRYSQKSQDYIIESLGANNISYATTHFTPIVVMNNSSLLSYYSRLNYSLNSKYLFTASIRADGSSKFSKDNRFSYFPSGAIAWRASEEEFIKDLNVFTNFKVRASYGMTGNQGIPAYCNYQGLNQAYYSFNQNAGVLPESNTMVGVIQSSRLANKDLRWETTKQYDLGVDMSYLNGKLSFTVDYYNKRTDDMLLNETIPSTTGYSSIYRNVGSVRNRGWEFAVNSVNITTKDFTWSTSFNLSANKNTIISMGSDGDYLVDAPCSYGARPFIARSGAEMGSMYGYKSNGVYKYSDFVEFYNTDGSMKSVSDCYGIFLSRVSNLNAMQYNTGATPFTPLPGVPSSRWGAAVMPGMAMFDDIDGDNEITELDQEIIGESDPVLYGGLSNTFTYKNFDLNVNLIYSLGNEIFVNNYHPLLGNGERNTAPWLVDGIWRPSEDSADAIYPYPDDDSGRNQVSSMNVEDASYLKVKSIQLGYNLPQKALSKLGISQFRVYGVVNNLCTLTKYNWGDPEVLYNNPLAKGFVNFGYPTSRSFVFGVRVTF